jgi:hypothetical protein
MRRLIVAVVTLSLSSTFSHAQNPPKVEVAGGYSFLYVVKGFTLATNGGGGSVAFNANNWLGVVGDFGAYHITAQLRA